MGVYTQTLLQVDIPIIVNNANRAPTIGDIANAFVDAGAVLDIPVPAPPSSTPNPEFRLSWAGSAQ